MLSNTVFNEGTNLLKEISAANRKAKGPSRLSVSNKKASPLPNSDEIANKQRTSTTGSKPPTADMLKNQGNLVILGPSQPKVNLLGLKNSAPAYAPVSNMAYSHHGSQKINPKKLPETPERHERHGESLYEAEPNKTGTAKPESSKSTNRKKAGKTLTTQEIGNILNENNGRGEKSSSALLPTSSTHKSAQNIKLSSPRNQPITLTKKITNVSINPDKILNNMYARTVQSFKPKATKPPLVTQYFDTSPRVVIESINAAHLAGGYHPKINSSIDISHKSLLQPPPQPKGNSRVDEDNDKYQTTEESIEPELSMTPPIPSIPAKKSPIQVYEVTIPQKSHKPERSMNIRTDLKIDTQLDPTGRQRSLSKHNIPSDKENCLENPSKKVTQSKQQQQGFCTPQNKNLFPSADSKLLKTDLKRDPAAVKSMLTEEEKSSYGDRFPEEYTKLDFLGRGGFALVWLGSDRRTGQKVAVKQMLKNHSCESQKKELYYGQLLFDKNGLPRDEFKKYEGINNIAYFMDSKTTKADVWYIMELGGTTLSKLLFEIKGEFFKGERVYGVKHLNLYHKFHSEPGYLRQFISDMAQALHLLSDYKVVHSDLKPDNILLDHSNSKFFKLKLIDFGSAFNYDDQGGNIGMATPEYMPPEVLDLLAHNKANKSSIEQLAEICQPWSVDVWSLGAILLEIVTGVPLWLSLKCRVEVNGKKVNKTGLFAVKGRAYDKILQKQKSVIDSIGSVLGEHLHDWDDCESLYDLICLMLKWDPSKRISPAEILKHPYIAC